MKAQTTAVSLEEASLGYPGRSVLTDVNISITEGEFIGVLGPNGAGKTTLFRALLGLLRPSRGRVSTFGRIARAGRQEVGYVPQLRSMPGHGRGPGIDLLRITARGHRWGLPVSGQQVRLEVDAALNAVGATSLAARAIGSLSGGERQRLLLAQALLGSPRLLILDEPLLSLDPRHQRGVIDLVDHLRRNLGITVLMSAHELNPLIGRVDRVLYLGGGRAEIGRVDQIVTGPVLTRLYGTPIEVIRAGNRVFVLSESSELGASGCSVGHKDVPLRA